MDSIFGQILAPEHPAPKLLVCGNYNVYQVKQHGMLHVMHMPNVYHAIIKGTTAGPYLRGPSLISWIYMKNMVIDSFTLGRSVCTLQASHLIELSAILCIMTYCHSIPKDI